MTTVKSRRMLDTRPIVPKESWTERIAVSAECMRWYYCPLQKDTGTIAEAWIDRGDMLSAHYCLNHSIELLLKAVYAINKEFLPPPKWRIFYLKNMKWLPKSHRLLNEAPKTKDLSKEDLNRKLDALKEIRPQVLMKIKESTGLTKDQTTKYCVERVLHQTPGRN